MSELATFNAVGTLCRATTEEERVDVVVKAKVGSTEAESAATARLTTAEENLIVVQLW